LPKKSPSSRLRLRDVSQLAETTSFVRTPYPGSFWSTQSILHGLLGEGGVSSLLNAAILKVYWCGTEQTIDAAFFRAQSLLRVAKQPR
jgi:hypothetical protein